MQKGNRNQRAIASSEPNLTEFAAKCEILQNLEQNRRRVAVIILISADIQTATFFMAAFARPRGFVFQIDSHGFLSTSTWLLAMEWSEQSGGWSSRPSTF